MGEAKRRKELGLPAREKKIKKKEDNSYRAIEDYNPSGMFVNNQKALMNIKDKFIIGNNIAMLIILIFLIISTPP